MNAHDILMTTLYHIEIVIKKYFSKFNYNYLALSIDDAGFR